MNKKNAFFVEVVLLENMVSETEKKRYKCLNCLKFFTGGNHLNSIVLWQEYTQGKQTYTQLAQKYDCSIKTIQRKIDDYKIENHPIELNIPNTTNAIDGHFADLKNKLRNHNGMNIKRKKKFIEGFLKA